MDFPDISYEMSMIQNAFQELTTELRRPSITMKPEIRISSNIWGCKYGDIIGLGETPEDAMREFDKEMTKYLQPHFYLCQCGHEIKIEYKTYMRNYQCPKCPLRGQWTEQPF